MVVARRYQVPYFTKLLGPEKCDRNYQKGTVQRVFAAIIAKSWYCIRAQCRSVPYCVTCQAESQRRSARCCASYEMTFESWAAERFCGICKKEEKLYLLVSI